MHFESGSLPISTRRWAEWRFRIPASGESAGSAQNKASFRPGSRHIVRSLAEWREVWTAGLESIGQVS